MSILKDSSAYQVFLEEGKVAGTRATILRLGAKKFGVPPEEIVKPLEEITDLGRLERMSERLLEAGSWQEVVATA